METTSTPPPPTMPPPSGGEPAHPGSPQRPADYYSAPPGPEKKSGCPRWLLFGCGGLGCLGLILIFVLGAWAMRGGGGMVAGFLVNQIQKDTEELFDDDVPAEDRQAFRDELDRLKDHIEAKQITLVQIQPLLSELQTAIRDQRLTVDEVRDLTEALREINETAAGTPISVRGSEPPGWSGT